MKKYTPKMICKICGGESRRRVCKDCIANSSKPCAGCGKQIPTITHDNAKTKSDKCVSCRMKQYASILRGKTCKVCKQKFTENSGKRICQKCSLEVKPCLVCGKPAPKYSVNGIKENSYCSTVCSGKAVPFEVRSLAGKKSNQTKWLGYVRKTTENKASRKTREYKNWRKSVFERDNYTCQKCSKRGGELHPHHIKPFAEHKELRYEVSNGVTLCKDCHGKEHSHTFIGRSPKPA